MSNDLGITTRIISLCGDNVADFARRADIKEQTFRMYLKGSMPAADKVVKIAEAAGVTCDWLLTGKGPKGVDDKPEDEFDYIPMAEAKLNAGGGNVVLSEDIHGWYAFRKRWIRWVSNSIKDLVLMQVQGDSMETTIYHGDTVMLDQSRKTIVSGTLFAIGLGDLVAVKRLEILHGDVVRVISDNRSVYPPTEVPMGDIRVIGQILWYARQLAKPSF